MVIGTVNSKEQCAYEDKDRQCGAAAERRLYVELETQPENFGLAGVLVFAVCCNKPTFFHYFHAHLPLNDPGMPIFLENQ